MKPDQDRQEPTRTRRLAELFDEVLDLAPAAARARLETLGVPHDLAEEVMQLRDLESALGPDTEAPPQARRLPILLPGNSIDDYVLVEPIAVGATADVWKAESSKRGGATVALKLQRLDLAAPMVPWVTRHFEQHVRCLEDLDHPSILPLLDQGILPSGLVYHVIPFVEGEALSRDAVERTGAAPLDIGRALIEAISAVHDAGWAHGDLKPDNLMLSRSGQLFVLDLGSARKVDEPSPETEPGVGRPPAWTAPERIRGEPPSLAADVFALGRMGESLLRGGRQWTQRHPSLRRALAQATSRVPADRHASAAALGAAWDRAIATDRRTSRRRLWAGLLGTAALLGLAAWSLRRTLLEQTNARAIRSLATFERLLATPGDLSAAQALLDSDAPGSRALIARLAITELDRDDEQSAQALLSMLRGKGDSSSTTLELEGWLRLGELADARAILEERGVAVRDGALAGLRSQLEAAQGWRVAQPNNAMLRSPHERAVARPELHVTEALADLEGLQRGELNSDLRQRLDQAMAELGPAVRRLGPTTPKATRLAVDMAATQLRIGHVSDALEAVSYVLPPAVDSSRAHAADVRPLPGDLVEERTRLHARALLADGHPAQARAVLDACQQQATLETHVLAAIIEARCPQPEGPERPALVRAQAALRRATKDADEVGRSVAHWLTTALEQASQHPQLAGASDVCLELLRTPSAPATLRAIRAVSAIPGPLGLQVTATRELQDATIQRVAREPASTLSDVQLGVWLCQELILREGHTRIAAVRPVFADSKLEVAATVETLLSAMEPLNAPARDVEAVSRAFAAVTEVVEGQPLPEVAARLLPVVIDRIAVERGEGAAAPWWELCGRMQVKD